MLHELSYAALSEMVYMSEGSKESKQHPSVVVF